jgi:raffinose/stachyose/melibiose transport system substrate-binding protein
LLRHARFAVGLLWGAALAFGVLIAPSAQARPADTITLTMIAHVNKKPAYDVLIPNFERDYPNIKIDITYVPSIGDAWALETVELGAGNAPDLLFTTPGSGSPNSVATLGKAGDLAPLLRKPWVRRSLTSITSADKYGHALLSFTPAVSTWGVFTNDDLFKRLGLTIPQTFPQLLELCQKAKAAGTVALLFPGATSGPLLWAEDMAVTTVYGRDKTWARKLRSGSETFDGSQGWHQALQRLIDMSDAGCFQPGAAGATAASTVTQFAQGQALMLPTLTGTKGEIDEAGPQFRYSHHPFPAGTDPAENTMLVNPGDSVGINAHSSTADQAAAQTFIDFIARPEQAALYAQTTGFVTQYQFLKRQFPDFMSDDAPMLEQDRYVMNPAFFWWNPSVVLALEQNLVGLITGQRSIDDILNAMDVAWKQGPG